MITCLAAESAEDHVRLEDRHADDGMQAVPEPVFDRGLHRKRPGPALRAIGSVHRDRLQEQRAEHGGEEASGPHEPAPSSG